MRPTLTFWQALPAAIVLVGLMAALRFARPLGKRLGLPSPKGLEPAVNALGLRVADLFELTRP